jgi:hypothetical protein
VAKKARPQGATLWLKDGWIYTRTPYDRDFVDSLKKVIPAAYRRWDPVEKLWKVDPSKDEVLIKIVTRYFGEPTVIEDKEQVVVAALPPGDDPYAALLKLAPNDLLKKIQRQIVSAVHPDHGGSNEAMATANSAWSAIKTDREM